MSADILKKYGCTLPGGQPGLYLPELDMHIPLDAAELEIPEGKAGRLTDISALRALVHLEKLILSGTRVSDITSLAGLTRLKQLSLSRTNVRDIKPIAQLTGLKSLSLSGSYVEDLNSLVNMTNLITLSIIDIPATDLTPLTQMTNLKMLHIAENLRDENKALLDNIEGLIVMAV